MMTNIIEVYFVVMFFKNLFYVKTLFIIKPSKSIYSVCSRISIQSLKKHTSKIINIKHVPVHNTEMNITEQTNIHPQHFIQHTAHRVKSHLLFTLFS